MSIELVLLPSPLLGPAVWAPAADALRRLGWHVRLCAVPAGPASAQDVLDSFLGSLPQRRELVLVPHSNAGLFVPELARQRDVVASVLVDAALPPREGATALAPSALLDFLAERADEQGLLPRWTQWWAPAEVDRLFPSQEDRLAVESEQSRLPLTYFRSSLPVPAGWADVPNAYLAFGDTYADERVQVERWGWPVATLPGRHLHMLVDPVQVARHVTGLLASLGVAAGS